MATTYVVLRERGTTNPEGDYANLGVLGMSLKLYTEILKDSTFNRRAKGRLPEEKA